MLSETERLALSDADLLVDSLWLASSLTRFEVDSLDVNDVDLLILAEMDSLAEISLCLSDVAGLSLSERA